MEINTGVLDRWMENHRKLGGHVFLVHDTYALVGSPEQYVTNLYDSFRQLSFETVNEFVAADGLAPGPRVNRFDAYKLTSKTLPQVPQF